MKISFVNHASVIIEHAGVRLITDPWLEGKVFNNGWDLISKTKLSYDEFAGIRYIWFSHEHPDHFSPPVLKKIPPEYRAEITVLFQETIDGRVAEFCRGAGFKEIIELRPAQWFDIVPGFSLLCEHFQEGDSWICFRCGDVTVLNTNDCAIKNVPEVNHIKKRIGKVDVLMTQFSYAYWAGNREDLERRRRVAAEKLRLLKFQCDQFNPGVVIPFASFVYFCHEENFYLNDSINTIAVARDFIGSQTKATPVILYNGDVYEPGRPWDSSLSVQRHMEDLEIVRNGSAGLVRNQPVDKIMLRSRAEEFIKNLRATVSPLLVRLLSPASIHLWDLDLVCELSVAHGLRDSTVPSTDCDVSMSSESLMFCLKNPYGLDTTQVNGRLQKPEKGKYARFYNFFRFDQQRSRGVKVGATYMAGVLFRKILHVFGLRR